MALYPCHSKTSAACFSVAAGHVTFGASDTYKALTYERYDELLYQRVALVDLSITCRMPRDQDAYSCKET